VTAARPPRAQAGAAALDITPPVGAAMGGYGRRVGVSTGIIDPLLVRALVLSDGKNEVAIAVCDLLGVGSDLVAESRRLTEEQTGIPAHHVLVAATHTHAGPAAFRRSVDPVYADLTARKVAGAVATALDRMEPVVLKVGTTQVATISQNRRDPEGPLGTVAQVLLVDRLQDRTQPSGSTPVATLFAFACHATVLEHDNNEYSPDFPGAAARFVERSIGGTALYLQGACGDVNPVWSRHDREEVERVGGVLGSAVTGLAQEMRPLDRGEWCINLSWSEEIPVRGPGELIGGLDLGVATTVLELPRRSRRPLEELDSDLRRLEDQLGATPASLASSVAERRALRARINELATSRLFASLEPAKATQRLEVQALRLSDTCAVVGLPGEFFAETGAEVTRRCGLPWFFIAGYANGSAGYVPPAGAFAEGGYEVGMTQFGPDAEAQIVDAAVATVRSLYA